MPHTQPARLNDPEFRSEFLCLKERDQIADSRDDSVAISAWGHFENDYARRLRWRKAKHVTEIVVERDEGAALADVLVELELQAAWVVGTGPIRSRVTSAP